MIYNGKAGINRNLKILTNDEEIIKSYLIDCNYFLLRKNKKIKNWMNDVKRQGKWVGVILDVEQINDVIVLLIFYRPITEW